MASGTRIHEIVIGYRDTAEAEWKALAAERSELLRRLGDKERYVRSFVEPVFVDVQSHPLVQGLIADEKRKGDEIDDALEQAEADHSELEAQIAGIENTLPTREPVNGEILRRYLTVKKAISDTTSRIVRMSSEISRARKSDVMPVSEEGLNVLNEKLSRLEDELALINEEHGADLVDRVIAVSDGGRVLSELRRRLDDVAARRLEKSEEKRDFHRNLHGRMIDAVVRRIMEYPSAGADMVSSSAQAAAALARFADANGNLPGMIARRKDLERQSEEVTSRISSTRKAISSLSRSNWRESSGRFPALSDEKVASLEAAYDDSLVNHVAAFCDMHKIPSESMRGYVGHSRGGSYGSTGNAFNRN